MRNYQRTAGDLGVSLCFGIDPKTGSYCRGRDHEVGEAEYGLVHWRDRRVSRTGLHRFLRLVARALDPSVQSPDLWRQVYRENVAIVELAHQLHVRIPREASLMDRAIVKAALINVPTDDPERGPAMRWARRKAA
jgi:hypothetical protein